MSAPAWLMRRPSPLLARWIDGGLAIGLTVWALLWPAELSSRSTARLVGLVTMTMAIAWRRRLPATVLAVEVAGIGLLTHDLNWPQGAAILIAIYSAALWSHRRFTVFLLLVVAGALVVASGSTAQLPSSLFPFLLLAPAWLAGIAVRHREQQAEAAAARANRLQRDREDALRAERTRIARELHDVVSHSVSVMVLQTTAARQILGRDTPRALALLESVETGGRSALDELRRLLGLLREPDEVAPLAPQPGVTEIQKLVERVRHAGHPVELCVEGQPGSMPGGAGVAAYRIVQEGLTNVLKHAAGAPTTVVIRWTDTALELEVADRGAAHHPTRPAGRAGRGITGMRERAEVYGGSLEAHPQSTGGYLIRARIPLEPGVA